MPLDLAHTIHAGHHHFGWSRDHAPVLNIAPGESVEFDVVDGGGGQVTPDSTAATIAALDFATLLPLTGPVAIDGAEPGDVLKVTVFSLAPSGWGWSAVIPEFGILADEFREPVLHIWRYDTTCSVPAAFGELARVPLKPFPGTLGVALAAPGTHSSLPPRRVGGNLDTRDMAEGAEIYLPVEVPGALFSLGDTHAAQGDGELSGSAIESPMRVALRFDLVKDARFAAPWFDTPGPVTHHLDSAGYHVAMGIGPDLMEAARDAVRHMIDLLGRLHGLAPRDAYMLCGVCADLRISEIVNKPNWVVPLYFPRVVFE
jgi:acetamidase/formamidase